MQRNQSINPRIDVMALACLAPIALGWFTLSTLVASFGRLTQHTAFYEMGVVMLHPAALLFGVGSGHGIELTAFTLLACATLGATLAPVFCQSRALWLTGWLPLALMLACIALLYGSGAPSQLDAVASSGSLRDDALRLASHLLQRAQNTIATHISVGAGGVLSLLASTLLAVRSTMNYLASEAPNASSRKPVPFSREPASS